MTNQHKMKPDVKHSKDKYYIELNLHVSSITLFDWNRVVPCVIHVHVQ